MFNDCRDSYSGGFMFMILSVSSFLKPNVLNVFFSLVMGITFNSCYLWNNTAGKSLCSIKVIYFGFGAHIT